MSDVVINPGVQNDIKTIQNVPLESKDIVKCRDASEQGRGPDGTQDEHDTEGDAIRIHILDMKHVNKSARNVNKDYMVYEYLVGAQKPKYPASVWVQQMGSEPTGGMDYEPDRNSFLLLVFIILFIMLALTAMAVISALHTDAVKDILDDYGLILMVGASIIMLMLSYGISCSACCRTFPCNIVVLVLAVVCMSIITAYITNRIRSELIFYAILATAGTVVVCMILACTSYDFTSWTLYAIGISAVFTLVVLTVGIAGMVTGTYLPVVHLIILIVGAIINIVILVVQLQMFLAHKGIKISKKDYALAALMLYTALLSVLAQCAQIKGFFAENRANYNPFPTIMIH